MAALALREAEIRLGPQKYFESFRRPASTCPRAARSFHPLSRMGLWEKISKRHITSGDGCSKSGDRSPKKRLKCVESQRTVHRSTLPLPTDLNGLAPDSVNELPLDSTLK